MIQPVRSAPAFITRTLPGNRRSGYEALCLLSYAVKLTSGGVFTRISRLKGEVTLIFTTGASMYPGNQ